jgi:hypothetical protein
MTSVFDYYRVNQVIKLSSRDMSKPDTLDVRKFNNRDLANYINERFGKDLFPGAPELIRIRQQIVENWKSYETNLNTFLKKEQMAYIILVESLDNELINKYIIGHDELVNQPKDLWEQIYKDFYPDDKFTLHFQISEFVQLKIGQNENIEDFALRIKDKSAQLKVLGVEKYEKDLITQMISGIARDDSYRLSWMACNNQIEEVTSVERAAKILQRSEEKRKGIIPKLKY